MEQDFQYDVFLSHSAKDGGGAPAGGAAAANALSTINPQPSTNLHPLNKGGSFIPLRLDDATTPSFGR